MDELKAKWIEAENARMEARREVAKAIKRAKRASEVAEEAKERFWQALLEAEQSESEERE